MSAFNRFTRRVCAASLLATALVACGGGGANSPEHRAALPTLVQDIVPAGTRIDVSDQGYFPASLGDIWTYDRVQGGSTTAAAVTRSVTGVSGNVYTMTETESGLSSTSTNYRRTAQGQLALDFTGADLPASVRALVGDVLEYAEPFYPIGGNRRVIRQGSVGEDLDGDGIVDSFRLEYSQVLIEFTPVQMPDGRPVTTAHFRNVLTFTLSPSVLDFQPYTVTATEDNWWAPHIGLVRSERVMIDSDGFTLVSPHVLTLATVVRDGQALFVPQPDGAVVNLALTHNDLVYDRTRNRYYASIPGSVIGQSNSIATIDAATGALSFSAPVGSEPSALALSADASVMYVGLDGSGDVVRLRLPDMVELGRTRLPPDPFFGQLRTETLTVSPLDANVVAVSTRRPGISPRHGGVVLIRSDVLQVRQTQEHTGSNLIVFDPSGQYVYGFNNETTEFGLRRIAVLGDGLAEEAVVAGAISRFSTRTLDWSPQGLVLETSLFRTPDLALTGLANVSGGGCRAHSVANKLVCLGNTPGLTESWLAVVNASTFVIESTPFYRRGGTGPVDAEQIVPGPVGQVALRFRADFSNAAMTGIWLFTSPALQ